MNAELKVNPGSRIWRSLESRTADCGSVKSVSQPAIRNSQFARNPLVSFLADKRRNIDRRHAGPSLAVANHRLGVVRNAAVVPASSPESQWPPSPPLRVQSRWQ